MKVLCYRPLGGYFMSIKIRLISVVTILLASIFIIGGLSITSFNRSIKENKNLENLKEMQHITKQIQYRLAGFSNDERGFLLTRDDNYAKEMEDKSSEILSQFAELETTAPSEAEKAEIEKIEENFNLYYDESKKVTSTNPDEQEKAEEIHFGEERKLRKEVLDPSFESFIENLDDKAEAAQKDLEQTLQQREIMVGTLTAIASVLGVILSFLLLRAILLPLGQLKKQMNEISTGSGDLTKTITVKNKDEIGEVAQSFNQFCLTLREMIGQLGISSEQTAASSQEFAASAEQTKSSADQVSANLQNLSANMSEQSSHLESSTLEVTKAFEGITAIASKVETVSQVAKEVMQQANEGEKLVTQVGASMNYIHKSVDEADSKINLLANDAVEIGKITSLINEIADQTNLLALNAAIESARAGEHGRGFAVVAEEVRKLAEQSGRSADQIRELIQRIQGTSSETVLTMKEVKENVVTGSEISMTSSKQFSSISGTISSVTNQIEHIGMITEQLSMGVGAVTEKMKQVSLLSGNNTETANQIAASTQEQLAAMEEIQSAAYSLTTISESLNEMIQRFKI
ncbi:methyl-accepting chemotaxis protein [Bacillus massiliglaciei]|uniref:methyl-accepting chemotaxis protein n=1 Tax=Bacillus massiliglaciei TaxID=1816693 RepID=UPI000DA63AE4